MLCLRPSRAIFFSALSISKSHRPKLPFSFAPSRSGFSSSSAIRMSSTAVTAQTTIEHIVLFKVKDNADPSKVNSMLSSLNGLSSLDVVGHLATGPLHRTKCSPIPFTHILHSRYSSKEDLNAYTVHPSHVGVVKENVLPVCDDILAVDWVADAEGPISPPRPGSAVRVTLLKVKEGLGAEVKGEILGVIRGLKEGFGGIEQLTCGENFSPARAKGYSIASIAVFPGLSEMEAVDSKEAMVELQKEKVRDYVESVIMLDFLVPSPQSASL